VATDIEIARAPKNDAVLRVTLGETELDVEVMLDGRQHSRRGTGRWRFVIAAPRKGDQRENEKNGRREQALDEP
jgi:hypothetical protein